MFKYILLFSNLFFAYGFKCFTPSDVAKNGLVSFEKNVYDISKYNHPGGQSYLKRCIGKPLEPFFYSNSYYFHLQSYSNTRADLSKIFVGKLSDVCEEPKPQNKTTKLPDKIVNNFDYSNVQYNQNFLSWRLNNDETMDVKFITSLKNNDWCSFNFSKNNEYTILVKNKTMVSSPQFLLYKTFRYNTKNDMVTFFFGISNNQTNIKKSGSCQIEILKGKGNITLSTSKFTLNLFSGLVNKEGEIKGVVSYDDENEINVFVSTSIVFFFMLLIFLVITSNKNNILFNHYYGKYPIGLIIFIIIYLLWYIGILTYSFTNENRTLIRLGHFVSLNLMLNILPITRNSIWVVLFHLSHERLLIIHRLMGVFCLLSVLIKLITAIILYNINSLFINNEFDTSLFGTLASFSIILTSFLSIPYIRKNAFELFIYSHKILFLITIIMSSLHSLISLYCFLPSIILYFADLVLRVFNTHKAIYSQLKIGGSGDFNTSCVFISVELDKKIKINPGSYFFICYNDVSKYQYHPLSVLSITEHSLTFCAKDMGENSWARKLKQFDFKNLTNIDRLTDKTVWLQGPYGHQTIDYNSSKYSHIIGIAGGIGITPIISILQDISDKQNREKNIVGDKKRVFFIWIVSHVSLVTPFSSYIKKLDLSCIEIKIYITQNVIMDIHLIPYVNIYNKRPKIDYLINEILLENNIINTEIGIMCCGPKSLSQDVIDVCNIHNIDCSIEMF
jgi:predicted ferric reductase